MSNGKKKNEFSIRNPDWYMILLTVATAWILYSQYWAMRVDTRPWIQVKPSDQNTVPQVGKPLAMPLQFVNVGKTPAKRLLAYMFVEIVDNDKAPHLPELEGSEIRSWTFVTSGIVFPSVAVDGLAKLVKSTSATTSEELPVSDADYQRLMDGKAYLAVYAVAYYRDAFNTKHWTTFCGWHSLTTGNVSANSCIAYNNVDDNLLW